MKQMKVGIVGTGLIASLMAKTLNGLNDENIKDYENRNNGEEVKENYKLLSEEELEKLIMEVEL